MSDELQLVVCLKKQFAKETEDDEKSKNSAFPFNSGDDSGFGIQLGVGSRTGRDGEDAAEQDASSHPKNAAAK